MGCAKLGALHPDTLYAMGNLGATYSEMKQGHKAAMIFREFVDAKRVQIPKDDPRFSAVLLRVTLDLLNCDQFIVAEEMGRECLAIREKLDPEAWTTFNAMSLLGAALQRQRKFVEAEPLLLKGYEGMKQREPLIPAQGAFRIPEALDRLIALYTELNKPGETAKYKELRTKYSPSKEVTAVPQDTK